MKILSRNFSKTEKILIAVLGIALIGLLYYKFVYIAIHDALVSTAAEADSIQAELDMAIVREARIQKMERDVNTAKETGDSRMGSYNNSKPETAFLNTVLAGIPDYSIQFADVTRDGNQIRRNFTLNFKTSSYSEARKIIKELTSGEFRCMIGDMSCSSGDGGVSVSLQGTFYETMVGGKSDSALPKDQADVN